MSYQSMVRILLGGLNEYKNDCLSQGGKVLRLVRCLEKRYGNFTYGKVYEAKPKARTNGKPSREVDYRVLDDEGDYYTVAKDEHSIKANWEWIAN